jgi:hypothetical protein
MVWRFVAPCLHFRAPFQTLLQSQLISDVTKAFSTIAGERRKLVTNSIIAVSPY